MFRRDRLCEPSACDDAVRIYDDKGKLSRIERCNHCDLNRLDEAVSHHPVISRARYIDFAALAGITVTLDDIDIEEFEALKVFRVERDRYNSEPKR